ncbi:MAG: hypothetical protein IIV43_07355 [Oscillospiraceae bacterium]|nr:hypothetical protein [Oscillospiraceae bacterium]
MVLLLSDLIHEFDARQFYYFEGYGEQLLILNMPNENDPADVVNTMVEFHDDMMSPSAMVLEIEEEFYLTAAQVCNTLNAGTRWYKHFVQETPEGKLQLCIAADYIAKELMSDRAFDLLMDFVRHVYEVKAFVLNG